MATIKGIFVEVLDRALKSTGIKYVIKDTPLKEFIPSWTHPIYIRKLSSGLRAPKVGDIEGEFKMGRLIYYAFYIGDTHAKDGRLIYIEKHDAAKLLAEFPDFFRMARDSVYLGRALLPYGNTYGGKRIKKMRIMIVKKGTVVCGMPIEDGSLLLDPKNILNRGNAIKLGATSNNYSIFQHLDWNAIASDVVKLANEMKVALSDPELKDKIIHGKDITWTDKRGTVHKVPGLGWDNEYKLRFLKINPQLAKHPWFSRGASEGSARWISSHAFAPYLSMRCYLAIAYNEWTLAKGKFIAYRHPVIAGSSTHALTIRKKVSKLPPSVKGGAVVTITGKWSGNKAFTIKGAGAIMELPDGIDAVCCEDNIKIGKRIGNVTLEADAYMTVIQRFRPTACLGVPYKDFKRMNGDYDGDLVNIIVANDIPAIFDNVKLHENDSVNFKLPRKNSDSWSRDNVERVLLNAMGSNMGLATILHSWYLSKPAKERDLLVPKLYPLCEELASQMGLEMNVTPDANCCLTVLQSYVQFQVEAIKNVDCDTEITSITAARIQSLLTKWTNERQPSYLALRRGLEAGVAFVTSFPQFLSDMDPDWREKMESSRNYKKQWEWRIHLSDGLEGGVPTECFKLHKAALEKLWSEVVENPDPYAPYTYATWVEPISEAHAHLGLKLCQAFGEHIDNFEMARVSGNINITDRDDVAMFRDQWRDLCIEFADKYFGGDESAAARALWRVSHTIGENRLTGATFLGYPDEAEKIIVYWSGSIAAHHCIMAGYKKMEIFKSGLPEKLQGTCELVTVEGKTHMRPIEPIKGHKERLFGYAADVEKNESDQGLSIPPDGTYTYKLTLRPSKSAYFATFDPIVVED